MRANTRRDFCRDLFRGSAAAAIAAPFLRRPAFAQTAPPKRLVVFATANGTVMNEFWPKSGNTFGTILKPLEPYAQKLLVMRGIDMKTAAVAPVGIDHLPDFHNALTGVQTIGADYGQTFFGGPSLDQVLAQALGSQTKFAVMNLGVQAGGTNFALLAPGAKRILLPENSPFKAFTRLFADLLVDPAKEMKLKAERKSIIDLVRQDLTAIRCELGATDKLDFDAHLESIREVERSLDFTGMNMGPVCAPPVLGDPIDVELNANYPKIGQLQMDVLAAAIACDRTRLVTLQWSGGASGTHHTWVGVDYTHHGVSHNSEGVSADEATRTGWLVKIETWFAQQFAYLVDKLDRMPDAGGGTVLDNTALIWIHEQSNGATHQRTDMPYVLAGSCGGFFKTGRFLNLGGKAHNGLLISLANAVGHPITNFGDPNFSAGPMTELSS